MNHWKAPHDHATQEDIIIINLLAYIAAKAYEEDRFGYFLRSTRPYAVFDLDSMQPVILEHAHKENV
jgi:hypothetical protein